MFDSDPPVVYNQGPLRLLDARRIFRDLPVVHVATTRPDGSPHVVPLWFVWREEAVYASCRRDSITWRNAEHDARVALSFNAGGSWRDYAGIVLLGRAEPLVPEHPALRGVMSQWFEKYRPYLTGGGFHAYAEEVENPGILRVRPDRIASWDHAAVAEESSAADG
jgi:nitroimidazol reductase NimA-like FMN-containing flavoprotein (pyridoxamine 5'-phosphate oxidase superfamily)